MQVHKTYYKILGLCLIFLLIHSESRAQNTDSLYAVARDLAFKDKNYPEAIALARTAFAGDTSYAEIEVFIARLYAWNQQNDSAQIYFETAIRRTITIEDAFAAYADFSYWNGDNDKAIAIIEKGLVLHPASEKLLLREGKIFYGQRAFIEARNIVDSLLILDPNNTEARNLAAQIQDKVSKNRIGVKYDHIHFDKQFPDPWQLASIDYTRQTKAGSFTARLNYANRFKTEGLQYELESYPIFSKTFYGYCNLAYSDNSAGVFPHWKAGASLYANLPKAFETELGIRYLFFNKDVFIYTLYIGKYYKRFLFGARTYLTPNNANIAQSYNVTARYYYRGIDDYIALNLGAGLSPDDNRINVQLNSNYKLQSYFGELIVRHAIRKLHIITLNGSVLNQEYLPSVKGNQIQLGIGYIRRF